MDHTPYYDMHEHAPCSLNLKSRVTSRPTNMSVQKKVLQMPNDDLKGNSTQW